jgi:hypothetical protein
MLLSSANTRDVGYLCCHDRVLVRSPNIFVHARTDCISLALGFVKLSILIMYRRIFDTPSMRICCNILGIITVIWSVLFIFLGVFQCTPIQKAWNPTIPGQCLDINTLFVANAVPNIVTDAVMVALPIYPVSRLRLPLSQRVAVIAIFMLGSFVCIASIYRLTTVTDLNPADIAFTLRGATIFGHVETAVAIMSACLPTLRPLFAAFLCAIGVSKGSYSDRIGSGKGATSSSGRITRKSSRKTINKKDIFVVAAPDGPRLSTKPLPAIPHPPMPTGSSVMNQIRTSIGMAALFGTHDGRRDGDLEKGRGAQEVDIVFQSQEKE